jgi:hypothetical protein
LEKLKEVALETIKVNLQESEMNILEIFRPINLEIL